MINDILGFNEQIITTDKTLCLEEMEVLMNNYEYLSEAGKLKTEEDFKKALDEAKKKKFKKSDDVKTYVYAFISIISAATGWFISFTAPTIGITISLISLIYSLAGQPKNKLSDLNNIKAKTDKEIRKLNDQKRKCKDDKEKKDIEKRIDGLTKISNECKKNIAKVQKQIDTHNYDESMVSFNIMNNFINESESNNCDNCDKEDDNNKPNNAIEEKCNTKHESITGLI